MQESINLYLKAALCLEERRNATPTPDLNRAHIPTPHLLLDSSLLKPVSRS